MADVTQTYDITQSVYAILGSAAIICGAFLFGWRLLWSKVRSELRDIKREVTPNGGYSSTNGDITARIESLLNDHIANDAEVQGEILARLPKTRRTRGTS